MSDPKRRCVQTSRDPEVWMQWFNEISSGEESPLDEEDSDEKEEDVCVESDHHETESEQEIPEVDQDEPDWEEETDEGEADTFYWGKDKVTKWKKGRSNTQVRTRSQNIIKLLPGTKGSARNARSETDCLKLFINDTVIRIITISTNIYIMKVKNSHTSVYTDPSSGSDDDTSTTNTDTDVSLSEIQDIAALQEEDKRTRRLPDRFGFGNMCTTNSCSEAEQIDFYEALNGPEADQWREAIQEELRSFEDNNAWDIVDIPSDASILLDWNLKK
ncbi:unnamed protein product [Acanthoscelides obtectus]|uniref:Uncharacterized protein n=1 Tax=Acanthoscelides obtectus TaxID=200917 RepID=A0A9P0PH44_ACAOB|nr:unnamed protein product [Acanthoscelides obtectus]CAK1643970.1 hypothetical protein AOBTE_LOCUS13757 [Acanthoscelides obtectus]